jgi:hypothetical protein
MRLDRTTRSGRLHDAGCQTECNTSKERRPVFLEANMPPLVVPCELQTCWRGVPGVARLQPSPQGSRLQLAFRGGGWVESGGGLEGECTKTAGLTWAPAPR